MSTRSSKNLSALRLRPHHLLCIQNYRGHGYSSTFNEKMKAVIARLQSADGARVEITDGTDDLCMTCPHRRDKACESDHPALFDSLVCANTGIAPGDTFTWKLAAASPDFCPDELSEITRCRSSDSCPAGQSEITLCRSADHCPHESSPQRNSRIPVMSKELLEKCCPGCSWLELCREIISNAQ